MAAAAQRRAPDVCVVDAKPLTLILRAFKDAWGRRPSAHIYSGRTLPPTDTGAIRYLALRTDDIVMRYDPDGRGVPESTIWNLVSNHPPRTTELRTADLLLVAMNRVEAFRGEITVRPNPHVSAARQAECEPCGGSSFPVALVAAARRVPAAPPARLARPLTPREGPPSR